MAFAFTDGEASSLFAGVPILGFSNVVAPVNKIAHTQNTLRYDPAVRRHVCQLSQSAHEEAKMAPGLFDVVRSFLEKQQVPPEVAKDFLQRKSTLSRYDSDFRLLWGDSKVETSAGRRPQ